MATVEGIFRILDRASGPMRRMEVQALATDRSIKQLGYTTDQVGTGRQIRQMNETDRAIRNVGRGMDDTDRRVRVLNRDLDVHRNRWQQVEHGVVRTALQLRSLGIIFGLLKLPAIGAAIGVVVQAVGALSGGVIALTPKIADLGGVVAALGPTMVGLGLAMVTARLAFHGFAQAAGGNRQALRQLTPEARKFLTTLKEYRPVLKGLRESAQGGLFTGLDYALRRIQRGVPTVNVLLQGMSRTLGQLARQAANRFTGQGFLQDILGIGQAGTRGVGRLGGAVLNLVSALRHLAVAAVPFTDWLTRSVLLWSRHVDAVAKNARETGRFAAYLNRTKEAMRTFGHFASLTWQVLTLLGKAARPLGDDLWRSANRGLEGWVRLHKTVDAQVGLTRQFLTMGDAIKAMFRLFGALGAAVFRMGTSPMLPRVVDLLNKAVPAVEKLFNTLANTFGPALAQGVADFATLLSNLGSGPLTLIVNMLDLVFKTINAIVKLGAPFKSAIGDALSLIVISRFLVKVGLLEKGWWRVAVAARAAAVSEGAAGVVGGAGAARWVMGTASAGANAAILTRGAGIVGEAGAIGEGAAAAGLAGRALGVAKLGLGVASKLALPLLGIQAALGAVTQQKSGSFGHQVAQGTYGAANALSFGLLSKIGHLGWFFATPEQRAGILQRRDQPLLQQDLASAAGVKSPIDRLSQEVTILGEHFASVRYRTTQTSIAYKQSLQQEIDARKQLIAQLRQQVRQTETGKAVEQVKQINQALRMLDPSHHVTPGTARRFGIPMVLQAAAGKTSFTARRYLEQALLGGLAARGPAYAGALRAASGAVIRAEHRRGIDIAVAPDGKIITGSRAETNTLRSRLQEFQERALELKSRKPTQAQRYLITNMVLRGWDPADATARVLAYEPHVAGDLTRAPGVLPVGAGARPGRVRAPDYQTDPQRIAPGGPTPQAYRPMTPQERMRYVRTAEHAGQAYRLATGDTHEYLFSATGGRPYRDPSTGLFLTTKGNFVTEAESRRRHLTIVPNAPDRYRGTSVAPRGRWGAWGGHNATGGRLGGVGLADSVSLGGGMKAAPGELIVNRHSEQDADQRLGGPGSLASIVGGETRKHSEPRRRFQMGGRVQILSPEGYQRTVALGRRIQGMGYRVGENPAFGGVYPVHAPLSYHYIGQALDVNAENMPGGEPANLDRLYNWLSPNRAKLGLSQLIWRAPGHYNHLHVAELPAVGGRSTYFPTPEGMSATGLPQNAGAVNTLPYHGGRATAATLPATAATAPQVVPYGQRAGEAGIPGLLADQAGRFLARASAAGGGARGLMTTTPIRSGGGGGGGGGGAAVSLSVRRGQQRVLAYLAGHGWQPDQLTYARRLMNYEDASGAPGDNNSSFGPRQLHAGGQLPGWVWQRGAAFAQKWGWSPEGLDYAAAGIAGFGSLHGRALAHALAVKQGSSNIPREEAAIFGGGGGSVYDTASRGGRIPWYGDGGSFTARRPTVIGVGDRGDEHVTITPTRKGIGRRPIELHVHIGTIENHREGDVRKLVHAEFEALARELELLSVEDQEAGS